MGNYKAANESHAPVNALNTDFLAFRVLNVKRVQHEKEVRKIYNQRARLRRETLN